MKNPIVTYTLQELQKITPNLKKEHFSSNCPNIKAALKSLFWNLGCVLPDKVELIEGVTTKNRFGCIDDSLRITVFERTDCAWIESKYASHQAKTATNDVELMRDIDSLTNRHSFEVEND